MSWNSLRLCRVLVGIGLTLALCVAARADAGVSGPTELAGVRLGETLDQAGSKIVRPAIERAIHQPFLGLAPLAPLAGYRSGYVDYGLCAKPERIVRIKLHYADASLAFFDRLLGALKKRYGEPNEWRGNAFGTLRTWKWGLHAADGQPVSLILMHYEGEDGAFTEGNSIRLSATGMVREEEACFAEKYKNSATSEAAKAAEAEAGRLNLDWYLPR
jgi:hypothetical protein